MILTYKYRLKGKRAKRKLKRFAWAVNQVWNFCVQTQKKIQRTWKEGLKSKWPSKLDLQHLTAGTSKDLGLHAQSTQNVCRQFIKSRNQHKKCPRFRKSSGPKRSLGWIPFQDQSRTLGANFITYLSHDFKFFGAKRRPLPEMVKGGCFVEDAQGHWYVCLQVDVDITLPRNNSGSVGIDLGLKTLATLSNGNKVEAPRIFRVWEAKLAMAQRANDKDKAKAINAKIKNTRADFLHKLSTNLVTTYSNIFVGNVSSSKLAKTKLAKSIYDAGWATLRTMIQYKASRHGSYYAEVEEKFTTQTCSNCGEICEESPKGIAGLEIRAWVCSICGANHDRDVNSAKNILKIGQSAMPLVEESRVA